MQAVHPAPNQFILPPGTEAHVYAKGQKEYLELPVLRTPDGRVITQWKLDPNEKAQLEAGGRITLILHTFNQPLQPIILTVGGVDLT